MRGLGDYSGRLEANHPPDVSYKAESHCGLYLDDRGHFG